MLFFGSPLLFSQSENNTRDVVKSANQATVRYLLPVLDSMFEKNLALEMTSFTYQKQL